MALENVEVLKNLREQKVQIEQNLETLRGTYQKVLGAIDVLEQIEESNAVAVEEVNPEEVERN